MGIVFDAERLSAIDRGQLKQYVHHDVSKEFFEQGPGTIFFLSPEDKSVDPMYSTWVMTFHDGDKVKAYMLGRGYSPKQCRTTNYGLLYGPQVPMVLSVTKRASLWGCSITLEELRTMALERAMYSMPVAASKNAPTWDHRYGRNRSATEKQYWAIQNASTFTEFLHIIEMLETYRHSRPKVLGPEINKKGLDQINTGNNGWPPWGLGRAGVNLLNIYARDFADRHKFLL